jgi:hypothetical protein
MIMIIQHYYTIYVIVKYEGSCNKVVSILN